MSRFSKRPRLTGAERDSRRQADRERVEQPARALLTTDGWRRWIKVRASNGLSRYSLRNQLLIAIDCHARGITRPTSPASAPSSPSTAAYAKARKPSTSSPRSPSSDATSTANPPTRRRRVLPHRPGLRRQHDRRAPRQEPVPLTPPSQPITGDSRGHLIAPLAALAGGTRIHRRDPRPTRRRARRVVRRQGESRSSSPPGRPTARSAHSRTRSHTPSGSATPTTAASKPRSWSTASPTSSALRPDSTSAASRSPTSQAGEKTAPSTRSAPTPARSTPSPAASKTHSTRTPTRKTRSR